MSIESSVVSISWIPSSAVTGLTSLARDAGVAHYDTPPPGVLADLEALRIADGFRFANDLRAWIEVDDGRIVGWGLTFAAVPLPDLQPEPTVSETSVRFVQTTGGRTGLAAPRRVNRPVRPVRGPTGLDHPGPHHLGRRLVLLRGRRRQSVPPALGLRPRQGLGRQVGPDRLRRLVLRKAFGSHSPWGDEQSPVIVTAVESELERQLSTIILGGGRRPENRGVKAGRTLVEQGAPGDELFVLLDGVLKVEVDGEVVAELGPGAILRERAILEAENPNLVGGDLGGGSNALAQQLLFRPVTGWFRYSTPVKPLYLCSASAHPGGGMHGMVGRNCARRVLADILLFAVTAQVISERLAPAMPRLAWYGKLVAWVGLFAGYAINAYGLVEWAMTDSTLSRPEMVRLMDTLQGVALPAVYQPGILTPLGFLALGIGLWRSHVVPTWTGAAFVFAAVTFPMGQIAGIFPVQVVCAALFLAGGIGLLSTVRSADARRGATEPATTSTPMTFVH
ncbi:MAG: cyclic nucleotide-binding domain-containing protein [Acidimicrobiales bacterium]